MQNDDNLYLRLAAQTTFNDKELVARAVGFSLGPGLVAYRRRAEPKRLSSRPRPEHNVR